jgi:nitrite reductase/ring-hydroxylating ferredoxin subunit
MAYHWIKIFESETELNNYVVPNTFVPFHLKGENICVTRTDMGVYAFLDRCPHNGAKLSMGMCSPKNEIICPIHRYAFDLESGRATSGGAFALKKYPIKIQNDGVYVGIKAGWWEF